MPSPTFTFDFVPRVDESWALHKAHRRSAARVTQYWFPAIIEAGLVTEFLRSGSAAIGASALFLGTTLLTVPLVVRLRHRNYWRANGWALERIQETVDAGGITARQGTVETHFAWTHWTSGSQVGDLLVIATGPKLQGRTKYFARRGLTEPERWEEFVTFVSSQLGARSSGPGVAQSRTRSRS